jgi:glycosyltransferase involved in cell wall biosynthesis
MALVSIIIPCFNQGPYLAESIGSVLASDYQQLEIIVVDDGSTDPETLSLLERLDYPKTRLIRQENRGLAAARNSGIAAANGEYILPLDADDRVGPQYISQAVAVLESDHKCGIVYCRAEKFGAEQGPWRLDRFSKWRMGLGNVIFCSAVYRRNDWDAVGGYDESLRRGWEDWDFWLGILELGRGVLCLTQVGFYYRKGVGSMAAGMTADEKLQLHRRMIVEHGRFYGGWGLALELLLPIYYRLADSRLYRMIKKGLGR